MFIVGIAGGTGSGKTTIVNQILRELPENNTILISQDNYYKDNSHLPLKERKKINFDHPDSIEFSLLIKHLNELKRGKNIHQPVYSFKTCTRTAKTINIAPTRFVLLEGILIFTSAGLRDLLDLKIFLDADSNTRLTRIIKRDIIERGHSLENTLERWEKSVKPMHQKFIEPSRKYADIIFHQGLKDDIIKSTLNAILENYYNKFKTNLKHQE